MDSVESRRSAIVAYINEKGEVTFAQLKEAFPNVSDMTLRTDLKNLDDNKRIVRIHGGARSVYVVFGTDDFLSRRSIRNVDAKKAIIMKAKELIGPGTSIFLDSGSTTTMLAAELDDQPNLIVTSSISCAMELGGLEKPQVLIVVDMMGNTRKLFVPLARALKSACKSQDHLCFLSYEQDIAKKAVDDVSPFYVRKKRFFEK